VALLFLWLWIASSYFHSEVGAVGPIGLCALAAVVKPDERVAYYKAVCTAAGLNPETKPLNFLTLDNKLVLYAGREATDQLRKRTAFPWLS